MRLLGLFFFLIALIALLLYRHPELIFKHYRNVNEASSLFEIEGELTKMKVVRVVDGDTVWLCCFNGQEQSSRLIGIDTPETVKPGEKPERWGKEASNFTKRQLTIGRKVWIELDVETHDRYGRPLVYVYLPKRNGAWYKDNKSYTQLNRHLVQVGLAEVKTFPPNVRYSRIFRDAQQEARENELGIWKRLRWWQRLMPVD